MHKRCLSFFVFGVLSVMFFSVHLRSTSSALSEPLTVGATYYGGDFDDSLQSWVIDNVDQCDRITAGEFTAASLGAILDDVCDDDSGLGYLNDTKLHNRVSYAELSNPPGYGDFSALGSLPAGTKLEINYQGRCVVAEKLDVGTGGYGVGAFPRAIDLWWQTARTIGFKNGFDTLIISPVSEATPLSSVGQTSTCGATNVAAQSQSPAPTPKKSRTSSNGDHGNTTEEDHASPPPDSPKDTSSKAYVRLPKTIGQQYGSRSSGNMDWMSIISYGIIAIFIVTETVLAVIILRRRNGHVSKRGHIRKRHR